MSNTIDASKYLGNTYEDLTVLCTQKIKVGDKERTGFIARLNEQGYGYTENHGK